MRQQKITLGEMQSDDGPTRLLIYCGDYKCAHSVVIDDNRWLHVRLSDLLSDLEPKFTCQACGHRGADVRPLFEIKSSAGYPKRKQPLSSLGGKDAVGLFARGKFLSLNSAPNVKILKIKLTDCRTWTNCRRWPEFLGP
jgi:hypothetical protein